MDSTQITSGIIRNVIEAIDAKKKPVYIGETFDISMGQLASITALKEAIDTRSLDCLDVLRKQKRITGTMYEYGLEKICEGEAPEVPKEEDNPNAFLDQVYDDYISGMSRNDMMAKYGLKRGAVNNRRIICKAVAEGNRAYLEKRKGESTYRALALWGLEKLGKNGGASDSAYDPDKYKRVTMNADTLEAAIKYIKLGLRNQDIADKAGISKSQVSRIKFAVKCMDNLDLDRLNHSGGFHLLPSELLYIYAKNYIVEQKYFRDNDVKKAGEMGAVLAEEGIAMKTQIDRVNEIKEAKELRESGSTVVEIANAMDIPVDNTVRVFDPYAAASGSIKDRLLDAVTHDLFDEARFLLTVLDAMKDFYDKREDKA